MRYKNKLLIWVLLIVMSWPTSSFGQQNAKKQCVSSVVLRQCQLVQKGYNAQVARAQRAEGKAEATEKLLRLAQLDTKAALEQLKKQESQHQMELALVAAAGVLFGVGTLLLYLNLGGP